MIAKFIYSEEIIGVFRDQPELLNSGCRVMDLLDTPQHIPFLGGLIQREIIYRILQGAEGG